MQLLSQNKLRLAKAAAGAATTDVEGDVIDMSGCDSVVFFATIATANAGNYIKVQEGDHANLDDAADLAGTKVVAAKNGDIVAVEVVKPGKRYIRALIIRGASTATGDMFALVRTKNQPADNNVDDVIVSEIHATPAAGTI